jgi:hypothetical protein
MQYARFKKINSATNGEDHDRCTADSQEWKNNNT